MCYQKIIKTEMTTICYLFSDTISTILNESRLIQVFIYFIVVCKLNWFWDVQGHSSDEYKA